MMYFGDVSYVPANDWSVAEATVPSNDAGATV
ncbi:hypothetical protein BDSB_19640 [Burkholderia dolosa PC543]|nr:hypothetical protein BDSB_19640 [Burkholderia dolosa PC543]